MAQKMYGGKSQHLQVEDSKREKERYLAEQAREVPPLKDKFPAKRRQELK